jgi:pyridoxal phosphate-dependent aminotransferase EpsN
MDKRIYLSSPHMGEEEKKLLLEAFDSNWIAPIGPQLDLFEKEFSDKIKISNSVGLVNGTAGLHLALILLGIGKGDEVFASTLTFAATINPICYLGAKPVLIDSDYVSWNIDPFLLEEALEQKNKINKLPKAVIVVSLYGQSADMDPIISICNKYNVPIIEDAAEALGATYKNRSAGTSGLINIFSFNGNKIITTSCGGMLSTENKEFANRAKFLSTQAKDPLPWYQHSSIGYNYRLSNLLAAIGRAQLQSLDDKINIRRSNYNFYYNELKNISGIEFMPEANYGKSTRWLTCITINPNICKFNRESLRIKLEKYNIESRPVWKPMHMQPIFSDCEIINGDVSKHLFETGLCLPSGSSLTINELEKVICIIKS